ncbi:AbrB family transcriptional regulator [Microvirga sp. M2]|uniref:AbrB family transcriptional regulator n=1 Tax=Microvirga sp. M2 TaxID=3073270 RepID=UPI0039C243AE
MGAAVTLLISVLTGYLASRAGIPLAWVLGPLIPTAAGAVLGVRVFAPKQGRQLGQLVVGTSIGLSLTVASVDLIASWFPVILLTSVASVIVTALMCVPFSRVARIDIATAYFSLTPGGLSEMARTGEKEGAQSEPVALCQTIRVAVLVCLMPWLLLTFGADGGLAQIVDRAQLPYWELGLLLAFTAASACIIRQTGVNNPWMIGGLIGSGILSASGLVEGRVPYVPFALGQFLIGISIGARFRRENLAKLPRVAIASFAFILMNTAVLLGYAYLVHIATGIDLSTMALSSSPGGLAEMALTAQALHLSTALITSFHVIRSFTVNAFSQHFYRLFRRIRLFDGIGNLLDLAQRRPCGR